MKLNKLLFGIHHHNMQYWDPENANANANASAQKSLEAFETGAREKQDHLYIYIYIKDFLQFTQLQLTS